MMLVVALCTFLLKNRSADCRVFRQWRQFVTAACLFALSFGTSAQMLQSYDEMENMLILKELNPYKKSASRGISNFVTDDQIEPLPLEQEIWLENVWVPDRRGVMDRMGQNIEQWQRLEEYREQWDIGSTGLYNTPDQLQKKAWFMREVLRYADKRLSGEIKQASEGSTLARVGQAQKALRPKVEASVSKNVKLKFRVRPLQGRGQVIVINPYVDAHANVTFDGRVEVHMRKELKDLGVTANVDYRSQEGVYVATVSKPLTDRISASVQSIQTEKETPIDSTANKIIQLNYVAPFD